MATPESLQRGPLGFWREDGEGLGDGETERGLSCLHGPTRWRTKGWGRARVWTQGRAKGVKGNSWESRQWGTGCLCWKFSTYWL